MSTRTLKTQINLAALVGETVTLRPTGSDLIGRCPFHDDKTPSLVVTPAKGLWHCLGACSTGGSAIDWLKKRDNLTTAEAITYLEQNYMNTNGSSPNGTANLHPKLQTAQTLMEEQTISPAERSQILKRCTDFFYRNLVQTPTALSYLTGRGLNHGNLLEEFQIGYVDNSFLSRLPSGKEGTQLKGKLKQLGILTKTGRVFFNGCIVFPFYGPEGEIVNLYGRNTKAGKNQPQHLYLPGPHTGIFNRKSLLSREVILTESVIDALSFWVHGFYNVTASYGTNGFTDEIKTGLTAGGVERIFIAYDNDAAGNKAATTLAEILGNTLECRRIEFPSGLDANEYIQQTKAPSESLKLLLQSAKTMSATTAKVPASGARQRLKGKNAETIFSDLVQRERKIHDLEKRDGAFFYLAGDREYKIVGLEKNLNFETLKLFLKVNHTTSGKFHLDNNIDLYASKDRKGFIKQAADELELDLEVVKKDVANLLTLLEEKQAELIKEKQKVGKTQEVMNEADRQAALAYLKDPALIKNILSDFHSCGLVGENDNALNGYLAATSRKEDRPLAILIQSSSGAGKSTLMDSILNFMPIEDVTQFSAMTGQSLFYMEESNLKHKILAIAEEEGAEKASYSLKLLQSEGKLTIASTGKDLESGRHTTQEYTVEGPVMLMITTTNCDIDEELLNRCIVLTINESREQTRRIHRMQRRRETIDGMFLDLDKDDLINKHRNVQRLLRPMRVHNPFAKMLTFSDVNFRTRRDQLKYLTLIRTITLLHQYQRDVKTTTKGGRTIEFIETTIADIELANRLAGQIFKTTLDDLPPQTRVVLDKIYTFVQAECQRRKVEQEDFRFSRREVREYLQLGLTQLRVHVERLVDHEYLVVHRGKRGQSFVYELAYRGEAEAELSSRLGLAELSRLKSKKVKKDDGVKP